MKKIGLNLLVVIVCVVVIFGCYFAYQYFTREENITQNTVAEQKNVVEEESSTESLF